MERWREGQRPPAEAFLAHHPSLPADGEAAFELVYSEFLVRESLGDAPAVEEFAWRFPQFTGRFSRQIELHRAFGMQEPTTHFDREGDEPELKEAAQDIDAFPVVPGYSIRREVGRGAVGVVYEAIRRGLNRPVALKVIRPWVFSDPAVAARFRAEAETAARLAHPNIIQVYEVGEHDQQGFLALEYAPGGSLQQKVAGAPQDARQSAAVVETLARALHHAARARHRPPRPEAGQRRARPSDGVPKITDFGLAKLLERDGRLTQTGEILGTPCYMAPEQAEGWPARSSRRSTSMPWAPSSTSCSPAGRPSRGRRRSRRWSRSHSQEPLPPGQLQRHVPRDLETICLKCLEKEPGLRYATAGELADDLRRFLDDRPIRARRLGWAGWLAKWCRREPVKAGLAASLLLALAVGFAGMAVLWRRAEERAVREGAERLRAEARRGSRQRPPVRQPDRRGPAPVALGDAAARGRRWSDASPTGAAGSGITSTTWTGPSCSPPRRPTSPWSAA